MNIDELIVQEVLVRDLAIGLLLLAVGVILIRVFWTSVYAGYIDPDNFKMAILSFIGNGLFLGVACFGFLIGVYKLGIPRLGEIGEIIILLSFYILFYFVTWLFIKKKLEKKFGHLSLKAFSGFSLMCLFLTGMLYLMITCS